MHESFEHLTNAFRRFVDAGFTATEVKYGLLGFWLGPFRLPPKFDDRLPGPARQRIIWGSEAWPAHFPEFQNPYAELLQFLDSGGKFGRWEQNILDVTMPDGEIWGVPLSSFDAVARDSLHVPKRVIPETPNCTKCSSIKVARLAYGLIDQEKIKGEIESGRASLAGCDVSETSPQWHCNSCGNEWGVTEWATMLVARREREAAALAKREEEALRRGVLDADLRPNELARCPFCGRSFDTKSRLSWDGMRHLSCGTYLSLMPSGTGS
jgi:hypothetical protein